MFHFLMADSGGIGGLFQALGLNWQAFLLDLAAFLVTAYIVGKYVFPPLTKALDAKKAELEAAVRLEQEAGAKLDQASKEAAAVIKEARAAADEIASTAKTDSAKQLEVARQRAQEQGERLVAEAREQLARDVLTARKELKGETAALVAEATGAVLGEKLDGQKDGALISRSLEKAK
jgi:F-type H+-transporting ATPase subunit b